MSAAPRRPRPPRRRTWPALRHSSLKSTLEWKPSNPPAAIVARDGVGWRALHNRLTLRSARRARLEGWAPPWLLPILRDAALRAAPQDEECAGSTVSGSALAVVLQKRFDRDRQLLAAFEEGEFDDA